MAHESDASEQQTLPAPNEGASQETSQAAGNNGHVRLLLLQARKETDAMRAHEVDCFARHLELPHERLEVFDLLSRPLEELYEALEDPALRVFIGGSGDYSVSKTSPPALERFIKEAIPRIVASGRPTFGSCWGLHTLAAGLGGRVAVRGEGEVGTYDVRRSEIAGEDDPLFAHLPEQFQAQMGHNDWVIELPPDALPLCENDSSPYQAVRFGEGPVYGLQFHAELSLEDNQARYYHYIENYGGDDEEEVPPFGASPYANTILARFRDLYCTPNGQGNGHGEASEDDN